MNVWDAIRQRNSIRVFKPDPIPRQLIEKVLQAGMLAPSSANMQPWEFVVVGGKDKTRLSQRLLQAFSEKGQDYDFAGKQIQFPEQIIKQRKLFFEDLFQTLQDQGVMPKPFVQERTFEFWGAPVLILVFMDGRLAKRFFFDVGACVENIVLAAQAEGLGTHLIGLILKYQNIIKESLKIAPDKRLAVGVCLGYPDPTDPINRFQPQKVGLDQVVNWIGFT
jgi:nitroreductase